MPKTLKEELRAAAPCSPGEISEMQQAIAAGSYRICKKTCGVSDSGQVYPMMEVAFPTLSRTIWGLGTGEACYLATKNFLTQPDAEIESVTFLTVYYAADMPDEYEEWLPILWEMVETTITCFNNRRARLSICALWVPETISRQFDSDEFAKYDKEKANVIFSDGGRYRFAQDG